jgi:GAF domain-containing protein
MAERGKADVPALLDRVARRLKAGSAVETREEITTQAVAEIPGTQMASLSITHVDGHMDSISATHPDAARCDELRDQLCEGPCRDVATDHEIVVVADLETDERYPAYGPRAAELGVRSEIAVDVYVAGTTAMALNLYARGPGAFAESGAAARAFASQAAVALGFADQVDHLTKAVASRTQIGQAVGMVMERYSVNEARAFGFLVRLSTDQNIKVRDIAADIVKQHNDRYTD